MSLDRVIVLGGAGFLGSLIAKEFLRHGLRVGIIDGLVRGTGGNPENIAGMEDRLDYFIPEKIEQVSNLEERIQQSDLVVDAMAFTGHLEGFEEPLRDTSANLICHLHLIDVLKKCPGKRVIYLGSRSQYGRIEDSVIREETPCLPIDPQGINKQAAESFFRIYSKAHQFHTLSLRLTNCFGPNQRTTHETGLLGSFIQETLDDRPINIFGSADRRKNFLYGDDVAKIVYRLYLKNWEGFKVYNVAGVDVTIEEVLRIIFEEVGRGSFEVEPFPEKIKNINVGEAVFCDAKIKDFLGPNSPTPLRKAIAATINYFEKHK